MGVSAYFGKEMHVESINLSNKNTTNSISIKKLKDQLNAVNSDICILQEKIATSNDWVGNGRDECAMVLMVLAKYCEGLGGDNGTGNRCTMNLSTDVSLECSSGTINNEHLQNLIDAIKLFVDDANTFDQYALNKSQNIRDLENIV